MKIYGQACALLAAIILLGSVGCTSCERNSQKEVSALAQHIVEKAYDGRFAIVSGKSEGFGDRLFHGIVVDKTTGAEYFATIDGNNILHIGGQVIPNNTESKR